jgi:predicted nucleic acid-binding protein
MGKSYLIDSNVFRKYIDDDLSERGNELIDLILDKGIIQISVITRIELFSWNSDNYSMELIKDFVSISTEYNLTEPIIQKTIEIRKAIKIKLPDAIIAATAMVNNLILLSDNDKDFGKILALKYINPRKFK